MAVSLRVMVQLFLRLVGLGRIAVDVSVKVIHSLFHPHIYVNGDVDRFDFHLVPGAGGEAQAHQAAQDKENA